MDASVRTEDCRQNFEIKFLKKQTTETTSLFVPSNDLYLVMLLTLHRILTKLTDMHIE